MFNWTPTLILIAISIPGVFVVLPRTMRTLQPTIEKNLKPGQAMPPRAALVIAGSFQALLLIAVACQHRQFGWLPRSGWSPHSLQLSQKEPGRARDSHS